MRVLLLIVYDASAFSRGHQVFVCRYGEACRYTAFGIYIFAFTCFKGYLLHKIFGDLVYGYSIALLLLYASFLLRNAFAYVQRARVVGNDLAVDTVFERCNYAAAVGIVFGISCKDKLNIQRHPYFKAAYLYIAFLQYVEEGHLYAGLQIGQFVDYEYAAVRPWDKARSVSLAHRNKAASAWLL